ncbi:unnamed protein product [Tilletia controversa]|uniref:RRM domain-containing protein n=1 Tax=Tilletia controversa TaxID=13291 RepID=A0A8X7SWG0_9BASI|nr:hypothetical protein CF328_g7200 [Tilletia controversa]KAE8246051.1 hypothetical protein A4X06_0g5223 [Tilletia controversa]CAD6937547.1 unnamed protein product [Tilletia controversa]CAD6972577.1 unnamed protein product [Tilletia controversa]CAD6980199.1 unnamed protein product [Tilletia controversa]
MVDTIKTAVDSLAQGVASITGVGAPSQQATSPEEAKKQVFVGNLAFATTEADLKTLFADAGTVASAQIITRGTRSLGYAFVTFDSEAAAQNAVQTLNKREVAGREINVEGAKPQSANTNKTNGARAPGAEDGPNKGGRGAGAGGARGAPGGARTGRGGRGAASSSARTPGGAPGATGTSSGAARRLPRAAAGADGSAPSGEPSQTLIFVANLPFSTDDDGLKAAFADYKITSAFVAKRFGRKSKGYGFVDAESHEEQTRIIENGKGLTIGDREVQLRVALKKADSTDNAAAGAGADAEGAEGAAAPATDAAPTETA